ncbi:hypothetical protein PsYK624_139900 [Phanerochaete sordida]|uniref:PH domain-containing protein n=1 Tax=Phanerochaete sordida TaxID=48140 RepID=A0A9P3GP40_9APHY|nr:hypothetical protein PsYK624_139900 [Phanerochaete sordida]
MFGRYGNLSEASSMLTAPALNSRASSTTAVVTPLEDFRTSRYVKPDTLPEELPGEGDTAFKDATSTASTTGKVLQGSEYSFDPEPRGPYFSIPLKKIESKAPLSRRGTTKELIGRYESLSTSSASSGGTDLTKTKSRTSTTTTSTTAPQIAEEKKGKGRSPIRQSIRSFLSVFNKKGKTPREPSVYVSDLLSPPAEAETETYAEDVRAATPPPPLPKSPLPVLAPIDTDPTRFLSPTADFGHPTCTTPVPLYTGTLLYLCNPVTPDGLPVWISCDATLHRTHILLTWFSALGNPSTSVVQLSQCTDVRSLAVCDLDSAESSMLPSNPEFREPKVFELLFEGKAREKFAAASVKERAGWVSAVWDAVLQTSAQRTPSIRSSAAGPQSAVLLPRLEPPSEESPVAISSRASSSIRDAELGSLAPSTRSPSTSQAEPVKVQLYDPPVSRTATPPPITPDRSTYSRLPTPGRQSPSVRHLDQMSIVQQRLAQLERETSLSTPSSSPTKSTRSRQIISAPVSPAESPISPRRAILLRHGTISSLGQESSAGSSGLGASVLSPLSPESGRLPSIPSGRSLDIEHSSFIARISRMNAPQSLERPDLFSPASQYSDIAKPVSPAPLLSMTLDMPSRQSPTPSPARFLAAYRQSPGLPEVQTAPLNVKPVLPQLDMRASAPLPNIRTTPSSRAPPAAVPAARVLPLPRTNAQTLADPPALQAAAPTPAPVLPQPSPKVTVLPDPEQHLRLSRIRGQISELQDEMHKLPETFGAVVAELPPPVLPVPPPKDDEAEKLLRAIDESVKRIEGHGELNAEGLAGIHAKVDAIMTLRQADVAAPLSPQAAVLPQETVDAINAKLEELGLQIRSDLPALSQKLDELAAAGAAQMSQDAPSTVDAPASPSPPAVAPEEVARLHERLEEILTAIQTSQAAAPAGLVPSKAEETLADVADSALVTLPALEELLALVKTEKEQRESQTEAQADSARYLNELNNWLETFVKHGTSQIEGVAAGVQNLCRELGTADGLSEDGQPLPPTGGLLSDIRQLLAETSVNSDRVAALQSSVEGLMAAVHDSAQAAEARNQFPTESVVAMIERQRQDQEHMLKTLATELSNDIRGERLRFVEAMKEATTINVQIHVEEFKKELTREVLSMTQEVTRLQRERQALEQQIADLFAFYAKQKQASELKQSSKKKGRAPPEGGQYPNAAPGRRPLPYPGQPMGMPGAM